MNEIQIFQNVEFGAIRTICNEQGDVMFCGKDVCDALGYSNGRDAVRKHVDGDDKTTVAICDGGSNYKSQAIFINESGLYSLILSSKLASAKRFKHWVVYTETYLVWTERGRAFIHQLLDKKLAN